MSNLRSLSVSLPKNIFDLQTQSQNLENQLAQCQKKLKHIAQTSKHNALLAQLYSEFPCDEFKALHSQMPSTRDVQALQDELESLKHQLISIYKQEKEARQKYGLEIAKNSLDKDLNQKQIDVLDKELLKLQSTGEEKTATTVDEIQKWKKDRVRSSQVHLREIKIADEKNHQQFLDISEKLKQQQNLLDQKSHLEQSLTRQFNSLVETSQNNAACPIQLAKAFDEHQQLRKALNDLLSQLLNLRKELIDLLQNANNREEPTRRLAHQLYRAEKDLISSHVLLSEHGYAKERSKVWASKLQNELADRKFLMGLLNDQQIALKELQSKISKFEKANEAQLSFLKNTLQRHAKQHELESAIKQLRIALDKQFKEVQAFLALQKGSPTTDLLAEEKTIVNNLVDNVIETAVKDVATEQEAARVAAEKAAKEAAEQEAERIAAVKAAKEAAEREAARVAAEKTEAKRVSIQKQINQLDQQKMLSHLAVKIAESAVHKAKLVLSDAVNTETLAKQQEIIALQTSQKTARVLAEKEMALHAAQNAADKAAKEMAEREAARIVADKEAARLATDKAASRFTSEALDKLNKIQTEIEPLAERVQATVSIIAASNVERKSHLHKQLRKIGPQSESKGLSDQERYEAEGKADDTEKQAILDTLESSKDFTPAEVRKLRREGINIETLSTAEKAKRLAIAKRQRPILAGIIKTTMGNNFARWTPGTLFIDNAKLDSPAWDNTDLDKAIDAAIFRKNHAEVQRLQDLIIARDAAEVTAYNNRPKK